MKSAGDKDYDVIVMGGGPGGSTAAIVLARAGHRVLVLEKARFPRFHIGESFLPFNLKLIDELGLTAELQKLPHVPKLGAEFATGDGSRYTRFDFASRFTPVSQSVNLARAPFDAMLLEQAEVAGATVLQDTAVKSIARLADEEVCIETAERAYTARYVVDASGQGAIIGRHLGTRKLAEEKHLRKTAYFNHFDDVDRPPGTDEGHPLIVLLDEGWFWMIPLDEKRTSVGLVIDPNLARQIQQEQGVSPTNMLTWAIERTPAVRNRMQRARGSATNEILSDFSYRCRPYAGEGYFLVGDAAAFMDPVFSTGVCVAMTEAREAANELLRVLDGTRAPVVARRRYIRFVESSTSSLFKIIRQYYDHSFRELFLEGQGPLEVHRAALAVLAGNVFPKPPFAVRWRMWLFDIFVFINRHVQLVPRRNHFVLSEQKPVPLPDLTNGYGIDKSAPHTEEVAQPA